MNLVGDIPEHWPSGNAAVHQLRCAETMNPGIDALSQLQEVIRHASRWRNLKCMLFYVPRPERPARPGVSGPPSRPRSRLWCDEMDARGVRLQGRCALGLRLDETLHDSDSERGDDGRGGAGRRAGRSDRRVANRCSTRADPLTRPSRSRPKEPGRELRNLGAETSDRTMRPARSVRLSDTPASLARLERRTIFEGSSATWRRSTSRSR